MNITRLLRYILPLTVFAVLMTPMRASAQSDPVFSQYWALPSYYNPGAGGTTDYLRVRGGARLQWLGIENAPKSFLISAESPLMVGRKKIGVGLNAMQESLGLFSNLLLSAQGCYKFKLLGGELSAGISLGYYNSTFRGSDVFIPDDDDFHESGDQSIPNQDLTGNAFDVGLGLHYSHRYFSVGLAGAHLTSPTVKMSVEGSEATDTQEFETELPRSFYFIADGNIPLENTLFVMQPSMLIATELSGFTADITLRTTYNRFLSCGIGYRWKDSLSIMAGAEYKNFFLGYAYSYPLSSIAKASSGSHELIAGYQLKLDFSGKNKNKHRSIRLM